MLSKEQGHKFAKTALLPVRFFGRKWSKCEAHTCHAFPGSFGYLTEMMNTAHNYHHKHRKPLIGNSEELTSNLFSETSEANANSSQKEKVADQACIEPGSVLLHIPRKGRRSHNIRSLYLLACFPIFSFRNLSKATCLNISILCRQLKPLVPSPGAQTSISCTFGISLVVDMHFPANSSWHLQKKHHLRTNSRPNLQRRCRISYESTYSL